ncbi:hypothetical protein SG34_027075 [Thalassomonas viridans]|uniref:Uncharacterized protein n=1 Tax=Thalassomonas viridans TaxID=137584 RepID=A0AAE9Z2M9_9GAMM|nr:hypothetical protein [Thalassomonas viridans]WDE04925.1 hypothetical protein SG34_027075 [Thalassomonas viridans]
MKIKIFVLSLSLLSATAAANETVSVNLDKFNCTGEVSTSRSDNKTRPESAFLFSGRYCFVKRLAPEQYDKKILHSREHTTQISSRYITAYSAMKTVEEKAQFVDLFLIKFTHNFIVNAYSDPDLKAAHGKNTFERMTFPGYVKDYDHTSFEGMNIFHKSGGYDDQRVEVLEALRLFIETNPRQADYDSWVEQMVNWTLEKPIKKSVSPGVIIQGDEGGYWVKDNEYETWAMNQALNWGNNDDWSFSWENGKNGERFIQAIDWVTGDSYNVYAYVQDWHSYGGGTKHPIYPRDPY